MPVESIFEFRFSAETSAEGLGVAEAIGADMPSRAGFLEYRVVQDLTDAGHVMVITRWDGSASADATLGVYAHDAKVRRATELMGRPPSGFVGNVLAR